MLIGLEPRHAPRVPSPPCNCRRVVRRLAMRTGFLAAMALLISACAPGGAQVTPLDHLPALAGDYFALDSAAAKHRYHIYVRLPDGYAANSARRYPTVYLLDGDSLFPYLAPHHLFLTYDDQLPEAIVVGIAYGSFAPPANRRDLDFGDGAPAFQRFLKSELIPAIERRTRADPARRILVGQSRGGGFVLYSAYTDPDLFWGRIASNPSFPLHRDLLMSAPAKQSRSDLHLAVVSGTRDRAPIRAGVLEWLTARAGQPSPWAFNRIEIEDGTHAADMPNAYRRAMNWLFRAEARR